VVTKRSLFKKTREDEDKACAAYCLGLMGSPEAKELLAALQDTKSPVVREHVHEALRALERPTRGG
jgi:HEAT repeat protein